MAFENPWSAKKSRWYNEEKEKWGFKKNKPKSVLDKYDTESDVEGYYYSKDGKFLVNSGNSDNVFVADSVSINNKGSLISTKNSQKLSDPKKGENMKHTEFQKISGKIDNEASGIIETRGIAHAGYNAVKTESRWTNMLDFFNKKSTAPSKILKTTDNSQGANEARAALIHALTGGDDPTDGAIRWDGTDFLAWGLNRPNYMGGGVHPKFLDGITISDNLLKLYTNGQLKKYPKGKVSYKNKKTGEVFTFEIPAIVFKDGNYFDSNNNFYYIGKNGKIKYKASASIGESIFWKKN